MKTAQILVFRTGSLGDLVCTIPAFRAIRARHSGHAVCLLADSPGVVAQEVHKWLLEWKIVDRIVVYRATRNLRSYRELFRLVRAEHADLAYLLTQQRESPSRVLFKKAFFRLCGLRQVFGQAARRKSGVVQPKEPVRLRDMVTGAGAARTPDDYAIPTEPEYRRQVHRLIAPAVDAERPFILFCCGGKTSTQRWPLERYREVLRRVYAALAIPVVALGLAAEVAAVGEWISEGLIKGAVLSAIELPAMFEVARSALCYFGNDTGPMHVAAAVGCPVAVVLSARNDPGAWDPDVEPRRIFQRRPSCHSCFLDECHVQRHRCMRDIGVDEVADGLETILRSLLASRV